MARIKYEIVVRRIPEEHPMHSIERGRVVSMRDFGIERVLFTGEMTPDQTIEILQHVNDLKQEQIKKVDNTEE